MSVDLSVERAIRAAARRQNSIVTWDELLAAGLSPGAIRHRAQAGRLWHLFFRVYCIADPALIRLARPTAAVLSVGDDARLSFRAATAAWGLIPDWPDLIDVTTCRPGVRPRPGVRLHRVTELHRADTTILHHIPITSLSRTLIDFATDATEGELGQAFGEARAKRRLTDRAMRQALDRAPINHPGAARIRAMYEQDPDSTRTRSENERLLRRLVKAAGLPQPVADYPMAGFKLDFIWLEHRLVLEVDAPSSHGGPYRFERDRRRDQILIAAGYTVIRVTRRQLHEEPYGVIARIAQALALRAA